VYNRNAHNEPAAEPQKEQPVTTNGLQEIPTITISWKPLSLFGWKPKTNSYGTPLGADPAV